MLGKERQNEIGRDRRDLIEPRLAEFTLDVVFFRETESAIASLSRSSASICFRSVMSW